MKPMAKGYYLVFYFFLLLLPAKVLAQTKIIQAIPTKSFGWLPAFIAQEKGLYRAEGLEVVTPVMKIDVGVAGLLSGETHFAVASVAMRAAMRGGPMKALMFYYDRSTWLLMVRPEIRSVSDLRGKNIAIVSYGSADEFDTRKLMRANGVPDKEYTLVPLGQDSHRIVALVQGHASAVLLNPDSAALAESKLKGIRRLVLFQDFDKYPFSGVAVSEKFLQESAQAVKKYLRATVKALVLMRDEPQEAARVAQRAFGMEEGIALSAVKYVIGAVGATDPGGFTTQGMRDWISDNAKFADRKPDEVKITDIADLTPLREAQQEMGIICEGGYGCRK
jgi:ABC-type nitrate/sulfonate/bicarbonate transport system substrate-binding protein